MVDTGATDSLLNPDNIPKTFVQKHVKPIKSRTASGFICINEFVSLQPNQINLPLKSDCKFHIFKFHNVFDGLIGNNILSQNKGEINYEKRTLKLNDTAIPIYFDKNEEVEYFNEINFMTDVCEPQPEIYYSKNVVNDVINDCRLDHLNVEERNAIMRVIHKHKDVFFHENDDLTFTNEVKHEIPTTSDSP